MFVGQIDEVFVAQTGASTVKVIDEAGNAIYDDAYSDYFRSDGSRTKSLHLVKAFFAFGQKRFKSIVLTYTYMLNIKGAGVILRDASNRILVVLGQKHNKWSFPKGHVDKDDLSPEKCAIRECEEETGIVVNIPNGTPYWKCNKYIYYHIGPENVTNWEINPQDIEEVVKAEWMSETEIGALSNANAPIRKYINKRLEIEKIFYDKKNDKNG